MSQTALVVAMGKPEDAPQLTELTQPEAWALAQLLKRITWSELRACAVDDNEAYQQSDAVAKLQRCLAQAGYSPR